MSDQTPTEKPAAESPTTARPIDFDDEQQETGVISKDGTTIPITGSPPPRTSSRNVRFEEEVPPPKPPRPLSPQKQAELTLKEAFPDVEEGVIRAVLVASGGQVEPAFNALLSMSDPNFKEETPPAQPPRPTAQTRQMQQDEMYARQLAEQYQRASQPSTARDPTLQRGQRPPTNPDERDYSFFDDELPEIKENLRQGYLATQSKVNKWISDFRKKIDGEDEEDDLYGAGTAAPPRQDFGPSQSDQLHGIRKSAERNRRSVDRERYDEDPRVLSDNFTELELRDDEVPPPKPARPVANPDLFKPTPPPPQTGPVDEVDALYQQPTPNRQPSPSAGNNSKKWQPLTSLAPNPDVEDNDPFSLGDSDEEREKSRDLRSEDTERLKRASIQKQGEEGEAIREGLQEHEQSGTKNKEAEDLLKGGS